MKKILVVHNNYRDLGGEDIAVRNEINYLKKYYEVETLFFSNNIKSLINDSISLIKSNNPKSNLKIELLIKKFKPDIVYIHNTWFKASLGIFNTLNELGIKTVVKLHNFRYYCTKSYLSKDHFGSKEFCSACGARRNSIGFFNKYYKESIFKSLAVLRYGKKYFNILKNNKLDLFVLTDFHKKFLVDLGIDKKKVTVFPNYLDTNLAVEELRNSKGDYLIYAGRISEEKGVEELIKAFLKTDVKNLKLKIVGTGPSLSSLKKVYKNKKIEFIGQISNNEVLDLISKSRAVVTATKLFEGQPTLLCESSSLGVPSIFPEVGGIKEFYPKDYKLSFKQFDYDDLTNKIKLLENTSELELIGKENQEFINNYLNKDRLKNIFKIVHD